MRVTSLLCCICLVCCATAAVAAPRRIVLGPTGTEVGFRAYGLGLLPIDGSFTRFTGSLTYDPDNHAACRVELVVDVASLIAQDPVLRDTIAGPEFLDAAGFPSLVYAGACQERAIGGTLGMHGVTRPFELSLTWSGDQVVAVGRLLRADWGMTAMPILAGRTVRIRVAVSLTGATPAGGN